MINRRSNANSDTFVQFKQDKNNIFDTTYKFTNPISQEREPVFFTTQKRTDRLHFNALSVEP
jgi:hypothetical protein